MDWPPGQSIEGIFLAFADGSCSVRRKWSFRGMTPVSETPNRNQMPLPVRRDRGFKAFLCTVNAAFPCSVVSPQT